MPHYMGHQRVSTEDQVGIKLESQGRQKRGKGAPRRHQRTSEKYQEASKEHQESIKGYNEEIRGASRAEADPGNSKEGQRFVFVFLHLCGYIYQRSMYLSGSQAEYHDAREHILGSARDERSINGVYKGASRGVNRTSDEHNKSLNEACKLCQVASKEHRGESGEICQAFRRKDEGMTRESFCLYLAV